MHKVRTLVTCTEPDVQSLHQSRIRARHSSHAGVSLAYLMGDFARLAYDWSGEENPTFLRLKEVFWQGDEKLGSNIRCPRDGRPGCALVDWLPREHRRLQTHFMSWSWKYSLQQLQSAMEMWRSTRTLEFEDIFFYMCFCVNNQFRIIVEGSATGSDNLEEVFQTNLRRIGQVVAVLDTWEEPVYLQRVWTIYEQYVACSLQVPVTFVMPEDAEVTQSLCDVDVAAARAFDPRDEQKVKTTIQSTVGFDQVNQHVKDAMIQWICVVVREKFQRLINRADREDASESSAMVALLWLRCWLCMLLSGVYGSHFSTRAELRDALLQRLGFLPSGLFKDLEGFNENISAWDTSKVLDMSSMFHGATAFNMPIGREGTWNTTSVQTMRKMFYKASSFNEPIDLWITVAVVDMMEDMFSGASSFDQPIGAWDTGNVRTMNGIL
ncbi:unnamed protein product [Durusdinium trenchii]|uniref:Uncharacterized protein n=1 Tax=Durusdinium trenchii TaxID=1381693 RepID=A0ABP0IUY1_9DINO